VPYYIKRSAILGQALSPQVQAETVWNRFLRPAFEAADQRPVFAVIHEIDPHHPYQPPKPYGDAYEFGYQGNMESWGEFKGFDGVLFLAAANEYGPWLAWVVWKQ